MKVLAIWMIMSMEGYDDTSFVLGPFESQANCMKWADLYRMGDPKRRNFIVSCGPWTEVEKMKGGKSKVVVLEGS